MTEQKGTNRLKQAITKLNLQWVMGVIVVLALVIVGLQFHLSSSTQLLYASGEAESGSVTKPATIQSASGASGGEYLQFGPAVQTPPPPPVSGYQGIFQFTGTPQYHNPYVAGGVLIVPWSTVEPQPNVFDWSSVNSQIAPWVAAGKKVAIRVQANELGDTDTPSWVFSQGVPQINPYGSIKSPIFWNTTYLQDIKGLAQNFAAEYNGNPNVAWVQATIGVYSETKVDTDNSAGAQKVWDANGYSDPLWFSTVKTIAGYYQQSFTKTPLVVSIDKSFIDGNAGLDTDSMVDWLTSVDIWPQDDGLRQTTVYSDLNWLKSPHISEQYLSTTSTGDTLAGDFKAGMASKPTYMLIYGSDIENPANQSVLAQYAH
jgi:hypothetical protein